MIDHDGIIERIEDRIAHVRITSESACAACHAKGVCGAAEQTDKYLDIPVHGMEFREGEKVRVLITNQLGLKAVAMGYVYPFLLLMAILIISLLAGVSELRAGLFALLSVPAYYLALFLTRQRISKTFSFNIQKPNTTQ